MIKLKHLLKEQHDTIESPSSLGQLAQRFTDHSRGIFDKYSVYEKLKRNPSVETITSVIQGAKSTFSDSEAHVVAALQAIPTNDGSKTIDKISKRIDALFPMYDDVWEYLDSFMTNEYHILYHNNSSINSELARIYHGKNIKYPNPFDSPWRLLKQHNDAWDLYKKT